MNTESQPGAVSAFQASARHSDAHAEEFRAMSLILQHRELLKALDAFEEEIARLRWEDLAHGQAPHQMWDTHLASSLRRFTLKLTSHFAAESGSTYEIFREHPDEGLVGALRQLDAEHPTLFQKFLTVTDHIEEAELPRDEILGELEAAIADFRRHEAREDELFGAG